MLKISFPPIVYDQSELLILGSLPGDVSLYQQQYYAHPQNRFWKILFALYHIPFSSDYTERVNLLHNTKLAVWDVCASAVREGSMDTAITEEIPNDITNLLNNHPRITSIYFNGQKALKLYDKYFERYEGIAYHILPSTSPANAKFSFEKLLEKWKTILR